MLIDTVLLPLFLTLNTLTHTHTHTHTHTNTPQHAAILMLITLNKYLPTKE